MFFVIFCLSAFLIGCQGMIERTRYLRRIDAQFEAHPAVAVLGPRQCGKTTLARMYAQGYANGTVTRIRNRG